MGLNEQLDQISTTCSLQDVLITNGERVLDVVERYATEVQRSFADELESIKRQHENTQDRMLRRLFSGHLTEDELDEIASVLSLRESAQYELIAVPEQQVRGRVATQLRHPRIYTYADHKTTYAFRARRDGSRWPDELPELAGGYIATVSGLHSLYSAASFAQRLSTLATGTRLVTIRDGLLDLASEDLADQIRLFHHDLVGDFFELSPQEQSRLFETLKIFMGNGSMQKSADLLFVHRNTVFKRFKRFEEITGLDVTIPRDASVAMATLLRLL